MKNRCPRMPGQKLAPSSVRSRVNTINRHRLRRDIPHVLLRPDSARSIIFAITSTKILTGARGLDPSNLVNYAPTLQICISEPRPLFFWPLDRPVIPMLHELHLTSRSPPSINLARQRHPYVFLHKAVPQVLEQSL